MRKQMTKVIAMAHTMVGPDTPDLVFCRNVTNVLTISTYTPLVHHPEKVPTTISA
jgi:hypothetical protein